MHNHEYIAINDDIFSCFSFSVSVFVCFIVCWTPYHIYRWVLIISEKYFPNATEARNFFEALHVLSGKYDAINQTKVLIIFKKSTALIK